MLRDAGNLIKYLDPHELLSLAHMLKHKTLQG